MDVARLDVDFSDHSVIEDPFPIYEEIRAAGRVVRNDALGAWMVTGYDDCVEILSDSAGERFSQPHNDLHFWFDAPNMINTDGSEHFRLRHSFAPYFTRSAMDKWEGRVGEVVDQLLGPLVEGHDTLDLIEFTKLPVVIVADLMGVPEERHDDFRRWSNAVTGNIGYGHEDRSVRQVMDQAVAELNAYLTEEIERHRRGDFDDLLTVMLTMGDMTEAEMRSTAVMFLLAGYDTTAKLMSTCLMALEEHPDQRALLVEKPSRIPGAIEEVLRWKGVAQVLIKDVVRDTALAGTEMAKGDVIYIMYGAANRDPSRWSDPHRFDIRRQPKTHLAFSFGTHLCIGAPLARLETKIALERLLRIAPEYHLREIDYGSSFAVRGPERGFVDLAVETVG